MYINRAIGHFRPNSAVVLTLVAVSSMLWGCRLSGFHTSYDTDSGLPSDGSGHRTDTEPPPTPGPHLPPIGDGGNEPDGSDTEKGSPPAPDAGPEDDGGSTPDAGEDGGGPTIPGTWVLVHAGSQTFTMGSPDGQLGATLDEVQHQVTFTRDFWITTTETTQGQFEAVMGYNPSYFSENGPGSACGPTCPVEQVSWHELAAYANALSALDGREDCYECHGTGGDVRCTAWEDLDKPSDCLGYRLPTEAEWEYAARAGSTTATYHGNLDSTDCDNTVLDAIAWYGCNASRLTHPVGQKADNALGLHDMLGNVWEWCHDWSAPYPGGPETDPAGPDEGIFRVVRGSSWFYSARLTRAAHRDEHDPDDHYMQNGGRVVRSAP